MKSQPYLLAITSFAGVTLLILATALSMHPIAPILRSAATTAQVQQITDRNGVALTESYQNRWNTDDTVPLYAVPPFLKTAFVLSEDRSYFNHGGVDWRARLAAAWQDLRALHRVRGASTITEQVVRMADPRSRTFWSKWVEGFEAMQLEREAAKIDILEFYLNQVPYAGNRRGIVQAARFYFGRDLSTLSQREMLALVVLARSPSGYDPKTHPDALHGAIERLITVMAAEGAIDQNDRRILSEETLKLSSAPDGIDAGPFVRYIRLNLPLALLATKTPICTTLDASLQMKVQAILDQRVQALRARNVHNAAALVADRRTGEILAWAVADANATENQIDAVLTPRQPGSALKPFLYTAALDKGWTPATMIEDSPLSEAVGTGLHAFRNYSNVYYGPVTLREALGNSLNIPAVRTIGFVGAGSYLSTLHALGFMSLDQSSEIYDEGLALGDGAVTLFEMVQGYAALANAGLYKPLRAIEREDATAPRRIYSPEAASLIGNILSDPWARALEFGKDSVLDLPVQTAAKTGTSTGYRDAWTMGFDDRYVIGLWMGNLNGAAMDGVTGSTGPALAFRSIFALLHEGGQTAPLYLSPRLVQAEVCIRASVSGQPCPRRSEWFMPGTEPATAKMVSVRSRSPVELTQPTDGLQMAIDPRVPADRQKFRFELAGLHAGDQVQWILDDHLLAESDQATLLWPLTRGKHLLSVIVEHLDRRREELNEIGFMVR
jgi:penicillin-binding protein 1C